MHLQRRPLSETGYDQEFAPLLVLWGARALYVGPAFGLSAHRSAVAVLAMGLDAPFGVARDPRDPSAGYRACRTALIAPNTLHQLISSDRMAFLYLDPLSRDWEIVRTKAGQSGESIAFDLLHEDSIIECLQDLANRVRSWDQTRVLLSRCLDLRQEFQGDPRVADAIARMRHEPPDGISAVDLARVSDLSVSRFLHVFKDTTGVPFRRYRLWCRLRAVVKVAKSGASLTQAAHAAGLAGSAHLSAAFRDMFGLSLTELNLANVEIIDAT